MTALGDLRTGFPGPPNVPIALTLPDAEVDHRNRLGPVRTISNCHRRSCLEGGFREQGTPDLEWATCIVEVGVGVHSSKGRTRTTYADAARRLSLLSLACRRRQARPTRSRTRVGSRQYRTDSKVRELNFCKWLEMANLIALEHAARAPARSE